MCTIKYTQKCLPSLAHSCLRPPFLSVARERIRWEYLRACLSLPLPPSLSIYVCALVRSYTPPGYAFSAGIRDIDGVPCTRYTSSPCSRSLNTISSFNRGHRAAPIPFLFSHVRAHNMCARSRPRGYEGCCSETSRSADSFIRRKWISPASLESIARESNRVLSLSRAGSRVIYLGQIQAVPVFIYRTGNV